MKKVLFFILTAFFFLATSCEKEVTLADFVVGTWESQELTLGDSPFGTFTAVINSNNTYTLKFELSDGSQSITTSPAGYEINEEKSQIIIEEPQFEEPTKSGDPIMITFLVTRDGNNEMAWQPVNDPSQQDDGPPTLYWTRK